MGHLFSEDRFDEWKFGNEGCSSVRIIVNPSSIHGLISIIMMIHNLGGGFKDLLFSSLFGEDSHFDEHIFQMGWFNHQLVIFSLLTFRKAGGLGNRYRPRPRST